MFYVLLQLWMVTCGRFVFVFDDFSRIYFRDNLIFGWKSASYSVDCYRSNVHAANEMYPSCIHQNVLRRHKKSNYLSIYFLLSVVAVFCVSFLDFPLTNLCHPKDKWKSLSTYLYHFILTFKLVASEKIVYFNESNEIYCTKCRFFSIFNLWKKKCIIIFKTTKKRRS